MRLGKIIRSVFADKAGATAIEYGLIAALVSIAFIVALVSLGSSVDDLFIYVATVLSDAVNSIQGN